MAARSRGYNQSSEWQDFNNSTYDADDDGKSGVELDHCRLYITNIPTVLNDEGLRTAFSKFGTVTRAFLSSDPNKRYAMVTFETPGEAKHAMTKLNRTEPLKLNIAIAQQRPRDNDRTRDRDQNGPSRKNFDNSSVSSKKSGRKDADLTNGDNEVEEDLGMNEFELDIDPNIHLELELEQIKLQQLELQEQQVRCKQRMLLLKQTSKRATTLGTTNRHILPGGRIVVRNVNDRNLEPRDGDTSYSAGAGDSRVSSRVCVTCGGQADSFCARCGLTPYCSVQCQRRDWNERHKAVCHNLAVYGPGGADVEDSAETAVPVVPSAAPLRRPHSPTRNTKREPNNKPPKKEEADSDRQNKVFTAPGVNRQHLPRSFNNNRGGGGGRFNNTNNRNQGDRRPRQEVTQNDDDEEEWGKPKVENQTPEPKPVHTPKPVVETPAPKESPVNKPTPVTPKSVTPKSETPKLEPKPVEPKPVEPKPVEPKPVEPKPEVKPQVAAIPAFKPGSVSDVTPMKKMVPKNYLLELLSIGDTVLLSVDTVATACATKKPGYICLAMHESHGDSYTSICEDYTVDCEADKTEITPSPGETFSYLSPDDGGWYRARSLGGGRVALLDSSKVLPLLPTDKCKKLPPKYEALPEFSCHLNAANVKLGDCLSCVIVSKSPTGYVLSLSNAETAAAVGDGEVSRWTPDVEYPATVSTAVNTQLVIPKVERPHLINNSKVVILDVTETGNLVLRPSDDVSTRKYEQVLQDVHMFASKANPLKELPPKGSTIVGKFTDGIHYRALCLRTNTKQNKCMLEYIEFANQEVTNLENLYPCPPEYDLSKNPTVASQATLELTCMEIKPEAIKLLQDLRDSAEELILTLPSGAEKVPSGSAVNLTVVKTKESLNKKIDQISKPVWKMMEEEGCKVMAMPPVMFSTLTYLELPPDGCEIEVLDANTLDNGYICGYQRGVPYAERVLTELSEKITIYANSEIGKQPYLPEQDELCIAQCPPYPQWFRGVVLSIKRGEQVADICYIDYGNIETVPINLLRKMMPEFVLGYPALASHCEIKDFPSKPTESMLAKAVQYMQLNEEGRGVLRVSRCVKMEDGCYTIEVPELLAVMKG